MFIAEAVAIVEPCLGIEDYYQEKINDWKDRIAPTYQDRLFKLYNPPQKTGETQLSALQRLWDNLTASHNNARRLFFEAQDIYYEWGAYDNLYTQYDSNDLMDHLWSEEGELTVHKVRRNNKTYAEYLNMNPSTVNSWHVPVVEHPTKIGIAGLIKMTYAFRHNKLIARHSLTQLQLGHRSVMLRTVPEGWVPHAGMPDEHLPPKKKPRNS